MRFNHSSKRYTVGHAWVSDFGSSDNKEEFESLVKISPLHNIKNPDNGEFPAVLGEYVEVVLPKDTFEMSLNGK